MVTRCEVCDSPSANTLHFGGRTCKACAAFFRRTVSMSMEYQCINGGFASCRIHHELRMICRQCRFLKCLRAGMKKEMVQARGDPRSPKEKSVKMTEPIFKTDTVVKSEPIDSSMRSPFECQPSTSGPSPAGPSPGPNGSWGAPSPTNYFYRTPSIESREVEAWQTLDQFLSIEASLNDRRRIMYTNAPIREIFSKMCDCPYKTEDLRRFDYRTYAGFTRHDFIMIYDYVRSIPGFADLSLNDKTVLYRSTCAVDCMIISAWYTHKLGKSKNHLVIFNGEYLPMDPLPVTGMESGAEDLFKEKSDFESYKNIMPIKVRQWLSLALPLCNLDMTFEEYCLIKFLTIWHFSYYHLSELGKVVCEAQRDQALRALHHFCHETSERPAQRIGELLMSMSCVLEQVHELTNSIVLVTFFDIIHMDKHIPEILNQGYEAEH